MTTDTTHQVVFTEARGVLIGSLDGVGARCTCGDEIRRDLPRNWQQHDLAAAENATLRWVTDHLQPHTTGHVVQHTMRGARCACGDRYVHGDPHGSDDTFAVAWTARHLIAALDNRSAP